MDCYLEGYPWSEAVNVSGEWSGWWAGRWGWDRVMLRLSWLTFVDELPVFYLRSHLC